MKVIAIIDLSSGARTEDVRAQLPEELREAWTLFKSGVIREAYAASASRVIFVLEAADVSQARKHMQSLRLVASGMMNVEYIELRPFANWQLLFAP